MKKLIEKHYLELRELIPNFELKCIRGPYGMVSDEEYIFEELLRLVKEDESIIDDLEAEIESLKDEIDVLDGEIARLEEQIENLGY